MNQYSGPHSLPVAPPDLLPQVGMQKIVDVFSTKLTFCTFSGGQPNRRSEDETTDAEEGRRGATVHRYSSCIPANFKGKLHKIKLI